MAGGWESKKKEGKNKQQIKGKNMERYMCWVTYQGKQKIKFRPFQKLNCY